MKFSHITLQDSKKPLWINQLAIVKEKMRKFVPLEIKTFEEARAKLKPDEMLISLDSNGLYERSAVIQTKKAYEQLSTEYLRGQLWSLEFCALSKEVLDELDVF